MRRYTITVNDTTKVIDVESTGANLFRVQIDGRWVDVELDDHRDLSHGTITPVIQPRQPPDRTDAPALGSVATDAAEVRKAPAGRAGGARDKLTAPMPGVILSIEAGLGASVRRGDPILVLEAMKMKNELRAPRDGVVAEIYVSVGQQVKYGEFLVRFEER